MSYHGVQQVRKGLGSVSPSIKWDKHPARPEYPLGSPLQSTDRALHRRVWVNFGEGGQGFVAEAGKEQSHSPFRRPPRRMGRGL